MKSIMVLESNPIIMTKDKNWLKEIAPNLNTDPGGIILLPEDAVLVMPQFKLVTREGEGKN